jgi:putative Mg2+ transporter-C (MgtC) family protein
VITERVFCLMAVRLGLAALGVLPIGLEREIRNQPAGIRTTMVISVAAALFTVTGIEGFGGPSHDPSRVAAQVVSGIGFLGAGAIAFQGASVRGMTTAATIWGTAAIGVASGAGLYSAVFVASPEIALILLLRPVTRAVAHGIAPRVTVHGAHSELASQVVARLEELKIPSVVVKTITAGDDVSVALSRLTLPRGLDWTALVAELAAVPGVTAVSPEGLRIPRPRRSKSRHGSSTRGT